MSTPTAQDSEGQETTQAEPSISLDVEEPEFTPQVSEAAIEQAQEKPEGKKGNAVRDREPGKSILPFTRVQKIMKADKDLPMVAKDATFLVSLATEEFIKRLSRACQKLAEREKRTIVQQRDVASIVRRAEEFLFLEEILGSQEPTGRRKPQNAKVDTNIPVDHGQQQSTLHNFVQNPNQNEGAEEVNNVIMDDDGVMYAE